MNDTITLREPLVFDAPLDSLTLLLKEIIVTEDAPLKLLLEVSITTYKKLEQQRAFHNAPKDRLDNMEIPFEAGKPIYLMLQWRADKQDLFPSAATNWKTYFENAPSTDPLLQEKHWNLLSAMQHEPVPESLGGGFSRRGYRTKFTQPLNKNDELRRKGPVTTAIVQALIESYFSIDFQEDQQAFVLELKAGEQGYKVQIKAQEETTGLWLQIQPVTPLTTAQRQQATAQLDTINALQTLGEFQVEGEQLVYEQQMSIPAEAVHYKWVQESLLTAVSLVHQQYRTLLLVKEK